MENKKVFEKAVYVEGQSYKSLLDYNIFFRVTMLNIVDYIGKINRRIFKKK